MAIVLSIAIPPLFRAKHAAMVPATAQGSADPSWWARLGAYDALIIPMWGYVSIGLLVWAIVTVAWVSVRVRRAEAVRGMSRLVDGIPVAVTEALGPATVGLWRSRVLIPRWVLGMPFTQRQYVLRHEEEHRRAYDTQLLFFTSLTVVLTPWYLPLYWQLRRLSLAIEMDCDNRVVAALGNAPAYGEMLLDIAQATNGNPRLQPSLLGGTGMLERRLRKLVATEQRSRLQRYLLPAFAIGLLYLVLSTPHPIVAASQDAQPSTSQHTHRK
jgi:beta-lactamase regulating signal transducer with metallopeptidase domain